MGVNILNLGFMFYNLSTTQGLLVLRPVDVDYFSGLGGTGQPIGFIHTYHWFIPLAYVILFPIHPFIVGRREGGGIIMINVTLGLG